MPPSPSLRFAETARVLSVELTAAGLVAPVFRTPPRLPGRDRTVRRRRSGAVVVAVRLADRPFAAVQADLVEGACVANAATDVEAEQLRRRLWAALERAGEGEGPVRLAAA